MLFTTAGQLLGALAVLDSDCLLRRRIRHYAAPDLLPAIWPVTWPAQSNPSHNGPESKVRARSQICTLAHNRQPGLVAVKDEFGGSVTPRHRMRLAALPPSSGLLVPSTRRRGYRVHTKTGLGHQSSGHSQDCQFQGLCRNDRHLPKLSDEVRIVNESRRGMMAAEAYRSGCGQGGGEAFAPLCWVGGLAQAAGLREGQHWLNVATQLCRRRVLAVPDRIEGRRQMVRIDSVDGESVEVTERLSRTACVPPVDDFGADEGRRASLERDGRRTGRKLGASSAEAPNDRAEAATDPLARCASLYLRSGQCDGWEGAQAELAPPGVDLDPQQAASCAGTCCLEAESRDATDSVGAGG